MGACANCGTPLGDHAAACEKCGRIVAPREKMPLWLGWIFGILITFATWGLIIGFIGFMLGVRVAPCTSMWTARICFLGIVVVCLTALAGGIDAARRGYPARAVMFLVPAIGALVPTASCSASFLGGHC